MSDLYDLYQEMILDHSKKPRNRGSVEDATNQAHGHNPLCGDKIRVTVVLEGGVVKDLRFEGDGCAISTASASLMTESVKGRSREEVDRIFSTFHALVTGQKPDVPAEELGKLAVFSGVSEFPMRVKCATLSWHTLQAALDDASDPVSTE
ncbi:MAG: SUF system NifU family Fe-S cluster assembly protein [Planctomycetes bacterium]|nr:SUF system NifU family Fe-S cluster assembly protein [Planctomycetota bacterium]